MRLRSKRLGAATFWAFCAPAVACCRRAAMASMVIGGCAGAAGAGTAGGGAGAGGAGGFNMAFS